MSQQWSQSWFRQDDLAGETVERWMRSKIHNVTFSSLETDFLAAFYGHVQSVSVERLESCYPAA